MDVRIRGMYRLIATRSLFYVCCNGLRTVRHQQCSVYTSAITFTNIIKRYRCQVTVFFVKEGMKTPAVDHHAAGKTRFDKDTPMEIFEKADNDSNIYELRTRLMRCEYDSYRFWKRKKRNANTTMHECSTLFSNPSSVIYFGRLGHDKNRRKLHRREPQCYLL